EVDLRVLLTGEMVAEQTSEAIRRRGTRTEPDRIGPRGAGRIDHRRDENGRLDDPLQRVDEVDRAEVVLQPVPTRRAEPVQAQWIPGLARLAGREPAVDRGRDCGDARAEGSSPPAGVSRRRPGGHPDQLVDRRSPGDL